MNELIKIYENSKWITKIAFKDAKFYRIKHEFRGKKFLYTKIPLQMVVNVCHRALYMVSLPWINYHVHFYMIQEHVNHIYLYLSSCHFFGTRIEKIPLPMSRMVAIETIFFYSVLLTLFHLWTHLPFPLLVPFSFY